MKHRLLKGFKHFENLGLKSGYTPEFQRHHSRSTIPNILIRIAIRNIKVKVFRIVANFHSEYEIPKIPNSYSEYSS